MLGANRRFDHEFSDDGSSPHVDDAGGNAELCEALFEPPSYRPQRGGIDVRRRSWWAGAHQQVEAQPLVGGVAPKTQAVEQAGFARWRRRPSVGVGAGGTLGDVGRREPGGNRTAAAFGRFFEHWIARPGTPLGAAGRLPVGTRGITLLKRRTVLRAEIDRHGDALGGAGGGRRRDHHGRMNVRRSAREAGHRRRC